MNKLNVDSLDQSFNLRGVVNFSKYTAASDLEVPREEPRVIACWLHVPEGAKLGSNNNRVFMMGFPDDYTEIWTAQDQRLLNREYWENGASIFGVEPETLFPVDVSLWNSLAIFSHGFKVTYWDSRSPVGQIHGERIYETVSINNIYAKYMGRSSGIDASGPNDLLIPTPGPSDYFLHYKIQSNHTIEDWAAASVEGGKFPCSELLFGLADHTSH